MGTPSPGLCWGMGPRNAPELKNKWMIRPRSCPGEQSLDNGREKSYSRSRIGGFLRLLQPATPKAKSYCHKNDHLLMVWCLRSNYVCICHEGQKQCLSSGTRYVEVCRKTKEEDIDDRRK